MQLAHCVPAIQFIVQLYWFTVDLCWWQCDTIVRLLLKFNEALLLTRAIRRFLFNAQLTGTISSTIGQLTALTYL